MKRFLATMVIGGLIVFGVAFAVPARQVSADPAPIVLLVDNTSPMPVQIGVRVDSGAMAPLGWCGPEGRCTFVVVTSQLTGVQTFSAAGRFYGDSLWDESETWPRELAHANVASLRVTPAPKPAQRAVPSSLRPACWNGHC